MGGRRKFITLITSFMAVLGLGISQKITLRRVLKVTELNDICSTDMVEKDIKSKYKEIKFKELKLNDIFFIEMKIDKNNIPLFEGPCIATTDVFNDQDCIYGIMIEHVKDKV